VSLPKYVLTFFSEEGRLVANGCRPAGIGFHVDLLELQARLAFPALIEQPQMSLISRTSNIGIIIVILFPPAVGTV
jgi:hypothetical protein